MWTVADVPRNGGRSRHRPHGTEGVPRDAINIAALAAQHAHSGQIDLSHVRRAARDWYLRDKQSVIGRYGDAGRTLSLLVDEVVGRRRSRTFLLPTLARTAEIEALCDARLLHVLRRGMVDPRRPGKLYDGFAVDYGCYVSLLLDGHAGTDINEKSGTNSAKSVPADAFNFDKSVVDLDRLET